MSDSSTTLPSVQIRIGSASSTAQDGVLRNLFGSTGWSSGKEIAVPGGTLTMGEMELRESELATQAIHLIFAAGSTVSLGLFTNWLSGKLQGTNARVQIEREEVHYREGGEIEKVIREKIRRG